jgi:hypothetical protein
MVSTRTIDKAQSGSKRPPGLGPILPFGMNFGRPTAKEAVSRFPAFSLHAQGAKHPYLGKSQAGNKNNGEAFT